MGTIGVYVPDAQSELPDAFDRELAACWPAGYQYHRSAALRALMRAATEAAPDARDAGGLPPDEVALGRHPTAADVEDAVVAEWARLLRVGATVEATAAELGWRRRSLRNWLPGLRFLLREADRREREREADDG